MPQGKPHSMYNDSKDKALISTDLTSVDPTSVDPTSVNLRKDPLVQCGTELGIWWNGDCRCYIGTVKEINLDHEDSYFVKYKDNNKERWYDLPSMTADFYIVSKDDDESTKSDNRDEEFFFDVRSEDEKKMKVVCYTDQLNKREKYLSDKIGARCALAFNGEKEDCFVYPTYCMGRLVLSRNSSKKVASTRWQTLTFTVVYSQKKFVEVAIGFPRKCFHLSKSDVFRVYTAFVISPRDMSVS